MNGYFLFSFVGYFGLKSTKARNQGHNHFMMPVGTDKKLPSAKLTLHSTKLCTKMKIFRKEIFSRTKVTSEAFLSISQNLKVTRLQGGTQTKL
jgi:hypothetical protein